MLPVIQEIITALENLQPIVQDAIALLNAAVPPSQVSPLLAVIEKAATDLGAAVATHKAAAAVQPAVKS